MVAPSDWEKAEAVLGELGFEKELGPLDHPGMATFASEAWMRGGENVDLHCTLWGMGAAPEQVWGQLSQMTEPMTLEGQTLRDPHAAGPDAPGGDARGKAWRRLNP